MTRSLGRLLAGAVPGLLTECATGPRSPVYTQTELRAECERQGGWWHPGGQRVGFCEYDGRQ